MDVEFDRLQPVFKWSKPTAGFYWEDVVSKLEGPTVKTPIVETNSKLFFALPEYKTIRYRPLKKHPTLFYKFADTEPTKKGILAFANKYGSLDHDAEELAQEKKDIDKRPPIKHESDSLAAKIDTFRRQRFENGVEDNSLVWWQREINEMSAITTLLEYWQNKDKEGLREVFIKVLRRRESEEWDFSSLERGWPYVDDAQGASNYVRQRIMPDIIFEAQALLMFWVNDRFEELFSGSINPKLSLNAKGVFESYFEPRSLLDAMWLQLYQAIIGASQGERRIKRCEICGKPKVLWEHGERKQNSNWRYHTECYDARKQKEYRDRKRQQLVALKKVTRGGKK